MKKAIITILLVFGVLCLFSDPQFGDPETLMSRFWASKIWGITFIILGIFGYITNKENNNEK